MDLTQVTHKIQQLTEELNVWLSEFCTPISSTGLCLDVSSAAMGEEPFTPIGATDQPPQYPPAKCGSVFMFPTTYSGEESWPALCQTLKEAINGCSLITRQTYKSPLHVRKLSYRLSCSHCCVHESKSRVIFKNDCVGPSNVPKEHLKGVKKSGNNSKGANMYNICSLFILFLIDTHNAHVFTMYLKRCEGDGF
jgi:hypothetical protein